MRRRLLWAAVSAGLAIIVLGAIGLMIAGNDRAPKTWIIHPGETLRLSEDEVLPEDDWECPGKGGVVGTPEPGHGVAGSGGFSVHVGLDGTVVARCEPGPPGNV
jgi:hypothetical protein